MKLEMKVNVEPEEFYEYMTYIIAKQIENAFGEPVKPENIRKGYSHKTVVPDAGKSGKMRYTITKAVKPKLFETTYTSGIRQTIVRYEILNENNKTRLVYSSVTKNFNGPAIKEGGLRSFSDFFEKQKLKWSLRRAIRQIKKARQ